MAKSRSDDMMDDNEDDRPRRKKKGGALAGIIPYKNGYALLAYYLGFAGIIVILGGFVLLKANPAWINPKLIRALMGGLGGFLALLAGIFGTIGIIYVSKYPEAKGTAHALIGILLGVLEIVGLVLLFLLFSAALPGG